MRSVKVWPPMIAESWYFACSLKSGNKNFSLLTITFKQYNTLLTNLFRGPMVHGYIMLLDKNSGTIIRSEQRHPFTKFNSKGADKTFNFTFGEWHCLEHDYGVFLQFKDSECSFDLTMRSIKKAISLYPQDKSKSNHSLHTISKAYPRSSCTGTLKIKGQNVPVKGEAWCERLWTKSIPRNFVDFGFEWVHVLMSNNTEIMVFISEKYDWHFFPGIYGVFVDINGVVNYLVKDDFQLYSLESDSSNAELQYPLRWQFRMKTPNINIEMRPFKDNQETGGSYAPKTLFWFGAADCRGTFDKQPVYGSAFFGIGREQSLVARMLFKVGNKLF
jgi:predicted secreted hydrolase